MAKRSKKADVVAIDMPQEGAGAVVFWNLSGTTSYADLEAAWAREGLPEGLLLNPATPAAAMRAAVKSTAVPEGYFVRQVNKHTFLLIHESQAADASSISEKYAAALKVGITVENRKDDDGKVYDKKVTEWAKIATRIPASERDPLNTYMRTFKRAFKVALKEISVHNFDWWIKKLMDGYVHTVALGGNGKPYYVAPSRMSNWESVRNAIHAVSDHTLRSIPAMRSEDCAEAVLDACLREVGNVTEGIYEDLEADDEIGKRALATRQKNLDSLLEKMQSFESLLGPKVDQLREDIEECRATVVEVEMACAEDEED